MCPLPLVAPRIHSLVRTAALASWLLCIAAWRRGRARRRGAMQAISNSTSDMRAARMQTAARAASVASRAACVEQRRSLHFCPRRRSTPRPLHSDCARAATSASLRLAHSPTTDCCSRGGSSAVQARHSRTAWPPTLPPTSAAPRRVRTSLAQRRHHLPLPAPRTQRMAAATACRTRHHSHHHTHSLSLHSHSTRPASHCLPSAAASLRYHHSLCLLSTPLPRARLGSCLLLSLSS